MAQADYPEPLPPRETLTGMDGLFAKTNIVVLILFALCCNALFLLPLILGIVGLITCKDPRAKQNALVVTIISGIVVALGGISAVINAVSGHH